MINLHSWTMQWTRATLWNIYFCARYSHNLKSGLGLEWGPPSTKHYLTQMLLAINWCYWQAGKKIHACVWRYKVASCKRASLKFSRFSKKKAGWFSNRIVYLSKSNQLEKLTDKQVQRNYSLLLLYTSRTLQKVKSVAYSSQRSHNGQLDFFTIYKY